MKIKNIQISNYRCFDHFQVDFGEQCTVLIGKNGSGKTSLLAALKSAMSFIFSKFTDKDSPLELISSTPDLHITNLTQTDSYFDPTKKSYQYPIAIKCVASSERIRQDDNNEYLNWELVKNTPNGKLLDTRYRDALKSVLKYYNKDIVHAQIPVFAFFSDSYPHKKLDIRTYAKKELKKIGQLSRAFGYYMWDAESNCSEIWQARYISTYSIVNDYKNDTQSAAEQRKEIEFIDNRMMLFTRCLRNDLDDINSEFSVSKITLRRPFKNETYLQFHFADGREILFENLPMGYYRLLSIVLDIAYRSYIINGDEEPHGIVLIDEIELHLHPSLQQEVLSRFSKTFPEIQFIVSTHSPLVISNVAADDNKNAVVKLQNTGSKYSVTSVDNVYGIDYNTNLIKVMETGYRASTVDKLINAYLILKGKKRETEADGVYKRLEEYIGGAVPELLRQEIVSRLKEYE